MLFSVCIPVYNTSKYLDDCLRSVLNQTETDYEIVLVDDGSTDRSGEICDRYTAEYSNVRVIHKENEGLMMTRRRGFQEARGEYLICLDSDDYWLSDQVLARIKEEILQSNCDLILYDYIVGKENPEYNQRINLFDKPDRFVFETADKIELYTKFLLEKGFNAIWIKAAARHVVDVDVDYTQWKEELVNSQGEDLFQTFPILDKARRIAYLKEPLYFYRWNPGSISKNVRPEYYYAYRTIYQRADEYLEKWNFDLAQIHQIMQGRLNMIFGVLLARCQPDRAKWLQVLREVSNDPYFRDLWAKRDSGCISRYYMLMGDLLLKKRFTVLQMVKKTVEALLYIKKRIMPGRT